MRRPKLVILVLALAAIGAVVAAQFKYSARCEAFRDVSYGTHDRNKLDLYIPKSNKPVPLLIWIHGGAWASGDKDEHNPTTEQLTRGYAVAAINYRYSTQAPFPAQIEDVKAAVRYLRANAKKYNLDPDAFGVWGGSAGGHLAALLGTTDNVTEFDTDSDKGVSSRVQCVIDLCGPTDLVKLSPVETPYFPVTYLLGGDTREKKELAAKASPITQVTRTSAPFLIIHGDADEVVPVAQSELLADALKRAGVSCELMILKGAGHSGPPFTSKELRNKYNAFLDKHLKNK